MGEPVVLETSATFGPSRARIPFCCFPASAESIPAVVETVSAGSFAWTAGIGGQKFVTSAFNRDGVLILVLTRVLFFST